MLSTTPLRVQGALVPLMFSRMRAAARPAGSEGVRSDDGLQPCDGRGLSDAEVLAQQLRSACEAEAACCDAGPPALDEGEPGDAELLADAVRRAAEADAALGDDEFVPGADGEVSDFDSEVQAPAAGAGGALGRGDPLASDDAGLSDAELLARHVRLAAEADAALGDDEFVPGADGEVTDFDSEAEALAAGAGGALGDDGPLASDDAGLSDAELLAPYVRLGAESGEALGATELDDGGGARSDKKGVRPREWRSAPVGPKALQVDGADVPADAWKRFTPEVVLPARCQARTWGGGRGGQCPRRPLASGDLCVLHEAESLRPCGLTHGYVTGEIPRGKLVEFVRRAGRRAEKALQSAADEELVKRGGQPRGSRGRKYWYARCRMWAEAHKLDTLERQAVNAGHKVEHLSDLTDCRKCTITLHRITICSCDTAASWSWTRVRASTRSRATRSSATTAWTPPVVETSSGTARRCFKTSSGKLVGRRSAVRARGKSTRPSRSASACWRCSGRATH